LLELVVGFITRSLALVADAFHILSDILGYVVAVVAVQYAGRTSKNGQYTYGFRRAETLGGFFNGGKRGMGCQGDDGADTAAFLMALGVSVLLQSIERFTEPSEISDAVMVMIVGAAGIGSNVLMLLILGGKSYQLGRKLNST
jgi:zinc transporter 1